MNNDRQLWFVFVVDSPTMALQNLFLPVTRGLNAVSNSPHFQAASKEVEEEANTDKAMSKEPPSGESLDGESAAEDDILESSQKPLSEVLTPKECFHVSAQLRLFF